MLSQKSNSRWDRYLGMTAAMTQVPVPTATMARVSLLQDFYDFWNDLFAGELFL